MTRHTGVFVSMWTLLVVRNSLAATQIVAEVATLEAAMSDAVAGDVILIADGTYRIESGLRATAAGTALAPIVLAAQHPGAVLIESDTVEAIKISGPYWQVLDLTIRGVCADHNACEHALHIVGAADGTLVRGNTFVDFNAQIKGNGEDYGAGFEWPDDVVVEGNVFYDEGPRQTANPVTKIDVVGGQRWRVEANEIRDFEKGQGDTISYGAFFKGHSKDGVFERNLVVCTSRNEAGVRIGLSLGGGGTSPDSICEDGTCTPEHERGTIRNNLIVHCSDVGVYLNEAFDSRIDHNTLFDTTGVDVRFPESSAFIDANLVDSNIRERDGGVFTEGFNLANVGTDLLRTWFVDPDGLDFGLVVGAGFVDAGSAEDPVTDDFCGALRDDAPDLGALEYTTDMPCATDHAFPGTVGESTSGAPTDTAGPTSGTGGSNASSPAGCGCATGPARSLLVGFGGILWGLRLRRAPHTRPFRLRNR